MDADSKDTGGRTPLSWAAKNRHDGVVLLLAEEARLRVAHSTLGLHHAYRIAQYLASKNIPRWKWSTFELVCLGLPVQDIGLGINSQPGTASKTYTIAEVTAWWREVILTIIKEAITSREGDVEVYSEYMSEFETSLEAELVPDQPPDLCHAFHITQYAAAQSMRR